MAKSAMPHFLYMCSNKFYILTMELLSRRRYETTIALPLSTKS